MSTNATENLFETASRQKLYFDGPRGPMSTYDLWDLPLTSTRVTTANLNDVAKGISAQIKATTGEEDFVNPAPKSAATELQIKLDIVKHVISVKQAEAEANAAAVQRKAERLELLQLRDAKNKEKLTTLSIAQIDRMLAGETLEQVTANPDGMPTTPVAS